jgi:hypothetical protein
MLSVELIPQTGRKMCFPAFDWLDDLPSDDWPGHFQGWHSMQLTLKELAERSGLERYEDAVEAFRAWAFAHAGRRYAILWSGDREPEDPVMIAMLEAHQVRRRTPAKDPQVEGWMW